ncbi:uncharacterized protein si:dkeyp-97a10.3 isoform X2 [Dunckerocampus dactyliophorus]|uniref:uncharacterized protein si:dkeyp-97a10.3 isoform X2 n=1 Tax=Dunckerocampus dactyliophorus TaxID=161453 RepID=UPI0024060648|nr:uncharacterized protein si:dkeyp-97a10.3 isoform X2 [Dunckerocampus dactyliophorus]
MRQLVSFFISLSLLAEAVSGVTLSVPSVAVEGGNITLTCTSGGTELSFQWGKDSAALTEDSRITIADGTLAINPGQRGDAGDYTCTVSNPLSALTATQSLTVFFGPDTPVLTKDAPKDCVGSADVLAGQVLRLTCTSDSLPPALFTWQRDGEPVVPAQPDSGVLSVQTSSTDDSGRFTCMARNEVTGATSEQATDVSVENTCLDVGEVVGIVIGSFLLLLILVLLIVLLVCLLLRRRARQRRVREAVAVQKNHTNSRPPLHLSPVATQPPDVPANGARDLGQGPDPPVFQSSSHARRPQLQTGSDLRALQLNGIQTTSDTHRPTHNGVDNPAFTHDDPHPTNPNILIQTGTAQSGGQPAAVQLSLNALPQGGQQNSSNAQIPTIHLNLNAFPAGSQHTQQEVARISNHNPYLIGTAPQGGPVYPGPAGLNSNIATSQQTGFIPTAITSTRTAQCNANTQTYQQEAELHTSPSHRQMPWDRLRGTPAYPHRTLPRVQSPDSTDDTSHQPLQQTPLRGGNPFREDAPPTGGQPRTRSHSADVWDTRTLRLPQLEPNSHSHRSPPMQRERARQDLRFPPGARPASNQEGTPSTNPFVRQPAGDPLGADTRAMADPNHLLQPGVAVVQTRQGRSAQTHGAGQPRQAASAPIPSQPQPSALTQAALKVHTERAQTFQNRRQQTQAALLHPGTQTQAPAAAAAPGGPLPPTPPPVIPLSRFQSLPMTRHRSSPTRGHHQQPQRRPQHRPGHHHPANVAVHAHARGRAAQPRQAHRGAPR